MKLSPEKCAATEVEVSEDTIGVNKQVSLEPVWEAILDVYKEFAIVCKRHGLRYYFTDGSAIGALRHRGFIPWDDDIDISMPREDYNLFMKYAPKELPAHLCVISIKNTPSYPNLHGKVQETRRNIVEAAERAAGYTLSTGIFIDLFPFDGWSGSRFGLIVNTIRFFLLDCVCKFRKEKFKRISTKGKLAWIAGMAISPLYDKFKSSSDVAKAYEAIYGVRTTVGCPYTARVRCWLNKRMILRSDVWGKPFYANFCGMKVPLPEKYDEYLRQEYGNYMKLPPVEKRMATHSKDGYHYPWWLGPVD